MDTNEKRDASVQAASEGVINTKAGDIVDQTVGSVCKYVNSIAGDRVLSESDNEVRRIILGSLLAYEERRGDAS
jgi:hypothetical protein